MTFRTGIPGGLAGCARRDGHYVRFAVVVYIFFFRRFISEVDWSIGHQTLPHVRRSSRFIKFGEKAEWQRDQISTLQTAITPARAQINFGLHVAKNKNEVLTQPIDGHDGRHCYYYYCSSVMLGGLAALLQRLSEL